MFERWCMAMRHFRVEFSKLKFKGKSISDLYQLIGKCLKLKADFYRVERALKPSAIIDLEKIALQCGT